MIDYVVGFLFSPDRKDVALVKKNKPAWQAGRLNGIGGKVEYAETGHDAMVREFDEETGVKIDLWFETAYLQGKEFSLEIFHQFSQDVYNVKTMEAEEIAVYPVSYVLPLPADRMIENLKFLIPLALDQSGILKPVMMSDYS